jgi:hypothetical protein
MKINNKCYVITKSERIKQEFTDPKNILQTKQIFVYMSIVKYYAGFQFLNEIDYFSKNFK